MRKARRSKKLAVGVEKVRTLTHVQLAATAGGGASIVAINQDPYSNTTHCGGTRSQH